MLKLKTIGAPYKQFSLTTGAYRIGSAPDSEFCVEDPSISAYHCEVVVTSTISVRDISDSHETYIDEEKIESASLQAGQTLRLGTVKLVLEEADAKAAVVKESNTGQFWANTVEARDRRARILELVAPPVILISVLGLVGGLIYNGIRNRAQSDAKTDPAEKKAAAKAAPPPATPAPTPPPAAESHAAAPAEKAVEASERPRPRTEPVTNRSESASASGSRGSPRLARLAGFSGDPRLGPLLEASLASQQQSLGVAHREVTKTLGAVGGHYSESGQFQKAEPYLKQAANNALAPKTPETTTASVALNNLSEMFAASGQPAKAEPLLAKALALQEKALRPTNQQIGATLHNLAAAKAAQGKAAEAIPLMERALKNFSQSLELDHPAVLETMEDLAKLNEAAGRKAAAEKFAKAAVKAAELTHGEKDPATAKALDTLGSIYARRGDTAQAAPAIARAASIAKQTLGPGHPETEKLLDKLASLDACSTNAEAGKRAMLEALQGKRTLYNSLLNSAAERHVLTYGETANPYSLGVAAGIVPELASDILRYKGAVLDVLLEQRSLSRGPSSARTDIEELRDARNKLAEIVLDVPSDWSPEATEKRTDQEVSLTEAVRRLEETVSAQVPGFGRVRRAIESTLEDVEGAIPHDAVLLEFIRYSRCVGNNRWEPCYGVVLIFPDAEPLWVSYGKAEPIEQAIDKYYTAATEEEFKAATESLYGLLLKPLTASVPASARTLLISPDEALNLVPFAALLTPEDEFLGQKYSVRYISTGRDLTEANKKASTSPAVILANPDFATPGAGMATDAEPIVLRDANRRQLSSMQLPRLSSLLEEGARIELLFRNRQQQFVTLSGVQASESELGAAESPRIIHLATCAFFLPEEADLAKAREQAGGRDSLRPPNFVRVSNEGKIAPAQAPIGDAAALSNPLQRSGVAFAGAQATFDLWGRGETPPPGNDGIATCDEIGTLALSGTELVVISASDFRTGMARSGQGILALRRSLVQAGAENLLIVLGTGAGDESDQILSDFYEKFLSGGHAARAMAEVQRDWLVRLRKDQGLMAAARIAGAFVVSSTSAD